MAFRVAIVSCAGEATAPLSVSPVLGTAQRGSALPAEAVSSSDTWLPTSVNENVDESADMTGACSFANSSRSLGSVLGSRLSNAFFPAGVTAVAWCSPLPTSRPRKTSMSPVSITCRPRHHAFVRPARAPSCHIHVTESSSGSGEAGAHHRLSLGMRTPPAE